MEFTIKIPAVVSKSETPRSQALETAAIWERIAAKLKDADEHSCAFRISTQFLKNSGGDGYLGTQGFVNNLSRVFREAAEAVKKAYANDDRQPLANKIIALLDAGKMGCADRRAIRTMVEKNYG